MGEIIKQYIYSHNSLLHSVGGSQTTELIKLIIQQIIVKEGTINKDLEHFLNFLEVSQLEFILEHKQGSPFIYNIISGSLRSKYLNDDAIIEFIMEKKLNNFMRHLINLNKNTSETKKNKKRLKFIENIHQIWLTEKNDTIEFENIEKEFSNIDSENGNLSQQIIILTNLKTKIAALSDLILDEDRSKKLLHKDIQDKIDSINRQIQKENNRVAKEQAAREKAAREEAAREKAAREKAAREKAAREEAAREKAAKEKEKADKENAEFFKKNEGRKKQIETLLKIGIPENRLQYAMRNSSIIGEKITEVNQKCNNYEQNKKNMDKLKSIVRNKYRENTEIIANKTKTAWSAMTKEEKDRQATMSRTLINSLKEKQIEDLCQKDARLMDAQTKYKNYEQENQKIFTSKLMKDLKKDLETEVSKFLPHMTRPQASHMRGFPTMSSICKKKNKRLDEELKKSWMISNEFLNKVNKSYSKNTRRKFIEKYNKILNSTGTIELLKLKEKKLLGETEESRLGYEFHGDKEVLYEIIKLKRELHWINTYGKKIFKS